MYKTLRSGIWLVLVAGGIAITITTSIIAKNSTAWIPVGIGVIGLWVGYAIFSNWFFGIKRQANRHLQKSLDFATFVEKDVGASRIADYVRTLEYLCENQQTAYRHGMSADFKLSSLKQLNCDVELVDWTTAEDDGGELISIPSNAVYFVTYEGEPFIARCTLVEHSASHHWEHEDSWSTGAGKMLEIGACSLESANRIIKWLAKQSSQHSVYRAKMLKVASPKDGTSGQTIRIMDRPEIQRDRIIVPSEALDLFERLVHAEDSQQKLLEKLGHASTIGVLLYGPPGTGKTLATKYAITTLKEHTIIVPADLAVETLRACFRLARYLPPAVIVIEDVDLLASNREQNLNTDGLQELMNEMDGINTSGGGIVVMSTNLPDVLEPALAARPGRVSQAIAFPLPDLPSRKQLLNLFLPAGIAGVDLERWARQTDGASPAFLGELCKRAVLIASQTAELNEDMMIQDLQISDDHLQQAMHELVVIGGDFTKGILGFPSDNNELDQIL